MADTRSEVWRIICFSQACGFAAHTSRFLTQEQHEMLATLVSEGVLLERDGFYTHSSTPELLDAARESMVYFPRKLNRALDVAMFARRISSIRFMALCNAVTMRSIRKQSDVDLFFICKPGTLWISRFLLTGYLAWRGWRVDQGDQDPVCLTFFVDDQNIDLSKFAIDRDIYLSEWMLSLLPLIDDGIGKTLHTLEIWPASRHKLPMIRLPFLVYFDAFAKWISLQKLPQIIREQMNKTTAVIVNDAVLKFHVDDAREAYRNRYESLCREQGIAP